MSCHFQCRARASKSVPLVALKSGRGLYLEHSGVPADKLDASFGLDGGDGRCEREPSQWQT